MDKSPVVDITGHGRQEAEAMKKTDTGVKTKHLPKGGLVDQLVIQARWFGPMISC